MAGMGGWTEGPGWMEDKTTIDDDDEASVFRRQDAGFNNNKIQHFPPLCLWMLWVASKDMISFEKPLLEIKFITDRRIIYKQTVKYACHVDLYF